MRPTENGLRCRIEYQNASGVWPDSVRPERSVIVPEIIIGSSTPFSSNTSSVGKARRLGVQRVEHRLDQDDVGAALDQPAHLLRVGLAQLVEVDVAEAGIVDVGRDRRRAVGRPDGAGDEARLVRRLRGPRVGRARARASPPSTFIS